MPRGKNEEATFTEEFLQFAAFYGFEAQTCNLRSGHEKGNVENKVGYLRYNFVTPAPVIQSFEHLGETLKECLTKDRERVHYEKGISIQELLDQEFPFLLALPDDEYLIFKANKYGEITIDQAKIHIPKGYNFGQLYVVKYWDRFKVLSLWGSSVYGLSPLYA